MTTRNPIRLAAVIGFTGLLFLAFSSTKAIAKRQNDKSRKANPIPNPKQVEILKGHGGKVRGLKFHPTKPLLFSCGEDAQLICHDFAGVVKRTKTFREINRKKVGDKTVALTFDSSGRILAASGVTQWGNGFGAGLRIFIDGVEKPFVVGAPTKWNYTSCDIAPDGSYVVMGGTQNLLRVASLLPKTNKKGDLVPSLLRKDAPGIPDRVRRVACHPNKPIVAAGGYGGWVYIYEVTLDGLVRIPKLTESHQTGNEIGISGLKFSPRGKYLISCSQDGHIRIYSTTKGKKIKDWRPVKETAQWLDIHPLYPWIVVGYADGVARVIDYDNKKTLSELAGHDGPVRAASFSSDGRWVATGGDDHMVRVWDLQIPGKKKRR